jgi:ankyrin repeat protein
MSVHRGRRDLLERHLARDPDLLQRTFSHQEIFPPELGCHADESLALTAAPLRGATLLHIAAEYEEVDLVLWLLDQGMDPNVRARTNDDRLNGHTALFHCVAYTARKDDAPLARLLLDRGADQNARASIRMQLPFAHDVHDDRDVTPIGWALQFGRHGYACPAVRRIIAEHGGRE